MFQIIQIQSYLITIILRWAERLTVFSILYPLGIYCHLFASLYTPSMLRLNLAKVGHENI